MDFGVVGFDGMMGSYSSTAGTTTTAASTTASCFANSDTTSGTKLKWYGSGLFSPKHERPNSAAEDDWRDLKVAKLTDDFSASKANAMLLQQQQRSPLLRSNTSPLSDGQQMLSFSSPNSQTMTLPYYHHAYGRNTGYGSGLLTGVNGPFTASQWMELEHQALIYKYITANSPLPSNLLIPIRKALDSAGFSGFPGANLRPSTLGWGAFHLGFSSNTDPEPGRCRRTDGKKWRCSRDAVADQKYCERHMNRGRHRSRKPVEGQSGHSVPGPTTNTAKLLPTASAPVVPHGGSYSSLGLSHHHQLNNLPGAPNPSDLNRNFLNKANVGDKIQDTSGLSMLSPNVGLKENQFSIPKKQNPYGESTRTEFGLVCSDSLLNPLQKSSSLVNCRSFGSSEELNNQEVKSQNSLRQFMDEWPKNQSERSAISWPDIEGTQLSISIPMASTDFMSSTSSPTNEKHALSPLTVSTQMGLGVDAGVTEPNQGQANWVPISWETSLGGPLGEVLHSTNSSAVDSKNASALNLMTEGWDSSPRLASSPTGVLQKTTFRSLSNSSAGSSPRTENRIHEGASLCNNLISSSMPAAL